MDINVMQKIKPGAKVRVHEKGMRFEGLVIARKHGSEQGATFTVRGTVAGVGMEKVYPIHSPAIQKVDVISSPKKVKRSKLYFVRGLSQKKLQKKLGVSL
ncbi:MAG: 50S ribosomal protein L19 [Candidatus Liptonbacteria bacterium]|nr:50S ribosomal protein L19 [Candidatus Liptonbacteria bacterium]